MRDKLLEKIELLRQQMVTVGLEQGLNHPDVLLYSQKIDQLHNVLLKMDKKLLLKAGGNTHRYRIFIREGKANFA